MKKLIKFLVCAGLAVNMCEGQLASAILLFFFFWYFVKIIKGIFTLAFRGAGAMTKATGRMADNIGSNVGQTIMGAGTTNYTDDAYRARKKAANDEAIRRYDARTQMLKNEYDARDAALRGKDIAARQYKNQADYYYRESRR